MTAQSQPTVLDSDVRARRPIRVAHVVSHPIQYFAPLYRELQGRAEVELTVFFCSDQGVTTYYDPGFDREIAWDIPLLDGYTSRILPSATRKDHRGRYLKRPNLDVALEVGLGSYDAVWLHGYAIATAWVVTLLARLRHVPVLLRDESTLLEPRGILRRALKEPLLRLFLTQVHALPIGVENARYLQRYGVPEKRMHRAPYAVDNDFFRLRAVDREAARRALAIGGEEPLILFCGKLVDRKQPLLLLDAFLGLDAATPARLAFAGDGDQRHLIEAEIALRGLDRVHLLGFLNQKELCLAYAAADLFVLPSLSEPWGLVVNEALNFGLPVVVSDRVGSVADLVSDGWNGYVVAAGDVGATCAALGTLISDPEKRRLFGARSLERVARYSVAAAADGIVAALREVVPRSQEAL